MLVPKVGVNAWPFNVQRNNSTQERYEGIIPLTVREACTDEKDPDSFFWDTNHRKYNDCVHSKRVGEGTGERVFRTLLSEGKSVLNEMMGFDGFYPTYFAKTYPYDGFLIQWQVSTSRQKWTLSLSIYYAYGFTTSSKVAIRYSVFTRTIVIPMVITTKGNHQYSSFGWSNSSMGYGYPVNIPRILSATLISEYPGYTDDYYSGLNHRVDINGVARALGLANRVIAPLMYEYAKFIQPLVLKGSISLTKYFKNVVSYYPSEETDGSKFLFHEDERIPNGLDFLAVAGYRDLSSYWWNQAVQHAYLDALQNMPRLNENSISNLIEIVGFIKSVVVDHRIEIPKSLSSAWLAYRYQYNTTKLDVKEAINFVHRHMDLGSLSRKISCRGTYHFIYKDTTVTCRCQVDTSPRELGTLGRIWRALYTYGLQPNFYVIWDMIPYSFIVDWFIPVGNLAAVADARQMYSGHYYDLENVMFSMSYTRRLESGDTFKLYSRWVQESPPQLNGLYFFEDKAPSSRVVGFRVLDAASLFLG